jgi:hypothetical protein
LEGELKAAFIFLGEALMEEQFSEGMASQDSFHLGI